MPRPVIVLWLGAVLLVAAPLPRASPGDTTAPAEPTPHPGTALAAALFTAIADGDDPRVQQALAAGAPPECEIPAMPEADALRARYPDGPLSFYLRREPGYTALMFAAALGNEPAVSRLLAAGADPNRLSRRSKTFALWQAARGGHLPIMRRLLPPGPQADRYRVLIDLARQQAFVWDGDVLAFESPISSGREETPTKTGRFLITNKYRTWTSNLYEARMPYFLRLSCGDFGLHAGHLPGYPASHGCVRLPEESARHLYALLPVGTLVEIR